MTYNPALTAFADSTGLWLEVSQDRLNQAWQHSQSFSSSSSRWNAYLNQLCLTPFLDWLRQEHAPQATVWPSLATLPSIWEVVNGTAISVDRTRFVLVPTETIDLSELRVPQEWVDIPGWAADYYLAVQVNPDEGYVQVWGYTTHQQLKQKGSYDPQERTYCLDEEQLIQNLNVLWVAQQLCPEPTKRAIAPLPAIAVTQAENLINRLGNPDVMTPRLAVPFAIWGALLEHGGWRQSLYHRRMGYPEQWSVFQWLQTGVSEAAKQLGWAQIEWQPGLAAARGTTQIPAVLSLSRHLTIAGQQYELQVIPKGRTEKRIWRVELRNARSGDRIPGGFKLRLLTEDLQPFEGNEDAATTAVDLLFVEVVLEAGEGLVWEIEPKPNSYEREILRF